MCIAIGGGNFCSTANPHRQYVFAAPYTINRQIMKSFYNLKNLQAPAEWYRE